jgi:hypothetical protein
MDKQQLVKAFNEWMRQYTEDPSAFNHIWQTVNEYFAEVSAGKEPSYGDTCVAFLEKLISEQ